MPTRNITESGPMLTGFSLKWSRSFIYRRLNPSLFATLGRKWLPHAGGSSRAHVMLCHKNFDVMAFTTPGESPLQCRQHKHKASRGHEDVEVPKERTPQPANTINLRGMTCGGNIEPNRRALPGPKNREPRTAEVRATIASC